MERNQGAGQDGEAIDESRHTVVLTLDVEADGGGFPGARRTVESFAALPRLLEALGERGLPLTAFVEGEILENRAELIRPLVDYGALIECHGYDHSCVGAGTGARIENLERGLAAYRSRFSEDACGFRAPYGIIETDDLIRLEELGVRYDSSIFPCFFPGRFNNFSAPLTPYRHAGTDLPELPFGALGGSRYPLALSYAQLIGWTAFRLIFELSPKPPCFIFNFHLHDLLRGEWYLREGVPKSIRYGYRATLRRNPFDVLLRFLDLVIAKNFRFSTTRDWLASTNVSTLPTYPSRTENRSSM